MPDRRPPDSIEPPDPFEGLVLDEEFIRAATVSEPSARTRMLTERWRHEPPVDPGGRRWSPGDRARSRRAHSTGRPGRGRFAGFTRFSRSGRTGGGPALGPRGRRGGARLGSRFRALSRGERWTAVLGTLIVLLVVGGLLFGPNRAHTPQVAAPGAHPGSPRPTGDRALPGGGTFAGSECGQHGYHHFPNPLDTLPGDTPPGPWLGFAPNASRSGASPSGASPSGASSPLRTSPSGGLLLDLELGSGSSAPLALPAPLGSAGIAVEIEGPNGVVAAAHGLPATVSGAAHTPDGTGWLVAENGTTAHLELPAVALCPGVDAAALAVGTAPRVNADGTVPGPPAYTLTVSVADPEIAELRRTLGTRLHGEVLAVTNLLRVAVKPV
ncbi:MULTISPECIES: hypothetical protein [Kitasatospora]|uniref:Uncharacterized protein n=1 Tax=Kitasatospora setae (strain ATCC 33774 / DSM 43861 / JCM 3304 / KCC A-0304 / NBRC 14216 / KM-6054) TaxID=452652 RepID=E4NJA5_KITSK|nr:MULTISPECIES: hypothetical protein [Kitasatospora]BAJ33053.1 hypothetical protein KSE_72980 [Kitasatospora setae KM-6054]